MIALSPRRIVTFPRLSLQFTQSQRENLIVALGTGGFVAVFVTLVVMIHYRLTADSTLLISPSDIAATWVGSAAIALVATLGLLALATLAWSVLTMREFSDSTEPLPRRHTVACVAFFPALAVTVTVAVMLARAF